MITLSWCVLVLFAARKFPSIKALEYMASEIWIIVSAWAHGQVFLCCIYEVITKMLLLVPKWEGCPVLPGVVLGQLGTSLNT